MKITFLLCQIAAVFHEYSSKCEATEQNKHLQILYQTLQQTDTYQA